MDEATFKETVKRLKQVNEILAELDESLRPRALEALEPFIQGEASQAMRKSNGTKDHSSESEAEFFSSREQSTPANRVYLIAAYIYSRYGSAEFEWTEIREIADRVGLTVSGRVDMTLAQGADKGKKLFRRAGRGKFAPTVTGEEYLKQTFGVKKGTKTRPPKQEDES